MPGEAVQYALGVTMSDWWSSSAIADGSGPKERARGGGLVEREAHGEAIENAGALEL